MTTPASPRRLGPSRMLISLAAASFFLGAVLYNRWLLALAVGAVRSIFHRTDIAAPALDRMHGTQLVFLATGAALASAAWILGRLRALDRLFRRPMVEKVLLTAFVVAVPIGWLEIALRPFLPPPEATTTIFLRDARLGWRLRPGAVDRWGGVEVRINESGFRGPTIPYARTAGARRVVWLGDSVTFGYRVARWEDTFPFVADSLVASSASRPVETVNLAVDGYSQWQEAIVMDDEGVRYDPDLVVLGFVLNDVTEMFHLTRFGGTGEGWQLRHASTSWMEHLLSRSAVVYVVQSAARAVEARRRFGENLRLGAIHEEELRVQTLMLEPEQNNVKLAWGFALADLQKIADTCASRKVPLLVVVFPFITQLTDPARFSAPQRTILAYARAHGLAAVDVLPALAAHLRDTGAAPHDLFLDNDHLTVEGHRVVAEILKQPIADLLRDRAPAEQSPAARTP